MRYLQKVLGKAPNPILRAFKEALDNDELRKQVVEVEAPDKSFHEDYHHRLETLYGKIERRSTFRGGEMVLYRCLEVELDKFNPKKPLGPHWTYNEKNIECWEKEGQAEKRFLYLVGSAPLDTIDVLQTLSQNASFDEEEEIRLKDRKRVTLYEIKDYHTDEVLKKYDQPLRCKV